MPTAPYDLVEDVLKTARVRLNDAIASIGGEVLTDTAAFTQVATNSAWRRFQEMLVDLGEVRFTQETILGNVGAVSGSDTGTQVWIDWTGYNNGSSLNTGLPLPQDFISPLFLWERVNGIGTAGYREMSQILKGLPAVTRSSINKIWEWRNERLYLPGATSATDIRIRYASYLSDFLTVAMVQWYNQPVPIMRALSPLAWLVCSEVAKARGDLDAGYFDQKGLEATMFVFNRVNAQGKQMFQPAESGKMTDQYTPAEGIPPRGVK